MSLWEFNAATGGYAKAHATEDDGLTTEEASRLADWLDEPPMWH